MTLKGISYDNACLFFLNNRRRKRTQKPLIMFFCENLRLLLFITSHSAAQTNRHRHGRICILNTAYRRHP